MTIVSSCTEIQPEAISVTFRDDFNESINRCIFPQTLTSLTFGHSFNQPIAPGVLPTGLASLTFGHSFNQPIDPGALPVGLTSLTFGNNYNQPIDQGILTTYLTSLTFGNSFDEPLTQVLPPRLISLTFGRWFDKPIASGVLPAGLISLTFGHFFNQSITHEVLPISLTSLRFGEYFNQPITLGVLPASLIALTFGDYFNQPIAHGVLPARLTSLTFGRYFDQPIAPGVLPASLIICNLPSGHPNRHNWETLKATPPTAAMQRLQASERARSQNLQKNERESLSRQHLKFPRQIRKSQQLEAIKDTYGPAIFDFVKLVSDAYPDEDPQETVGLISEQLEVPKDHLREYWASHFGAEKQVFPNSRYYCNNWKLLDQSSYTYLEPDSHLIVDENNDCFTFEEFINLYRASTERGSPFNSPYRSRTTFSDISPKYLGGLDIRPYIVDTKLRKFAESRVGPS